MDLTQEYIQLRSYLWSIAYNMTGEVEEAEDIVQDGFEEVHKLKDKEIANPKSYFTRIIINKSIDRSEELKKKRSNYPGTWLPEPYVSYNDETSNEDVLPYALMHLAEHLNPVERAVFILREAFDYSYAEVAAFCNITEANCRQILHRAREKISKKEIARKKDRAQMHTLLQAFLKASLEERPEDLHALLEKDIKLYSDGGGKAKAARKTLEGTQRIVKFFTGITRKAKAQWTDARWVHINHQPGLIVAKEGRIDLVTVFEALDGKINNIFIIRNPEKISHVKLSQNKAIADI